MHKPNFAKVQEGSKYFFSPNQFIQPKLNVSPTDDIYERQSDTVADSVIGMKDVEQIQTKISPMRIQRKCSQCDEKEKLQGRKMAIVMSNQKLHQLCPMHLPQAELRWIITQVLLWRRALVMILVM
jgi:hypothetical protein